MKTQAHSSSRLVAALAAACFAFALTLGAGTAFGLVHPVPDTSQKGSATIELVSTSGKAESGAELTLYRVADVASDDGDFIWELSADFASSGVDLTDIAAPETARALAKAASGKKAYQVVTTNAAGKVVAKDLEVGAYLVVQEKNPQGFVRMTPFVFTIPAYEEAEGTPEGYGEYLYDVVATPKVLPVGEVQGDEGEEGDDPSGNGGTHQLGDEGQTYLPQTGQLWWPVPVLLLLGIGMIASGVRRKRKGQTEE